MEKKNSELFQNKSKENLTKFNEISMNKNKSIKIFSPSEKFFTLSHNNEEDQYKERKETYSFNESPSEKEAKTRDNLIDKLKLDNKILKNEKEKIVQNYNLRIDNLKSELADFLSFKNFHKREIVINFFIFHLKNHIHIYILFIINYN